MTLAAFSLLLALAPGQTTDGRASLLPAKDLARLRAQKYRSLLPTQVPKGYKFDGLVFEGGKLPVQYSYQIDYRSKAGARLVLQMASDGFGDVILEDPEGNNVDFDKDTAGKNPIFGKFMLVYGFDQKKRPYSAIDWLTVPGKPLPSSVSAYGEGVSAAELKKFAESLRWFKKR